MNNKLLVLIYLLCCQGILLGKSLRDPVGVDSTTVMTLDDYYRLINSYHPIVRQTATLSLDARAQIRMQKGLLDPSLNVSYRGKELAAIEYYQMWDNTLKIPVWFGTDFKVGYLNNTGGYVNPENQTTGDGLWYLGVSVPLGQGLFIDERRKTIQQSQLLPQLAEAERVTIINNILLKATTDYWDWHYAWKRVELLDSAFSLAANRFEAIKARASLGELPWIDTVEAKIALVEREMVLSQALTELSNALLQASIHLWNSQEMPVELAPNIIPFMNRNVLAPIPGSDLDSLIAFSMTNHPELLRLNVQLQVNKIEERYQRDLFKPKFSLEYNFLTPDLDRFAMPIANSYNLNNYKLGMMFTYPLFLRKERGKMQQIQIKQMQLNAAFLQKQREITISIKINHANWVMLQSQTMAQTSQLVLLTQLRDAEQTKFNSGESSFFLVNTREMALINSQLRLYELETRAAKTRAMLYWSTGGLLAT